MIVGLQWLFNSKLYHKTLKSEANRVLDYLSNRLSRILAKDFSEHPQEVKALESGMKRFMKVTHDRRDFNTNLTDDSVYRVTEMISVRKNLLFIRRSRTRLYQRKTVRRVFK